MLVTVGTSVQQPGLLTGLVSSVTDAGFEVVVTVEPGTLPNTPRVHQIGFVPLARLLPEVDAVVGTGGLGTVQATLSAGLPTVLRPVLADQPWNAQRVADAGAGIVIEEPTEAGPAVRAVLTQARYRAAAQAAAATIRLMPTPDVVLGDLLIREGRSRETGPGRSVRSDVNTGGHRPTRSDQRCRKSASSTGKSGARGSSKWRARSSPARGWHRPR